MKELDSLDHRQAACGSAYGFLLLVGGIHESKAILKALAIAHFCIDGRGIADSWKLKFEFDDFSDWNVAGYRSSKASIAKIFGAAIEFFRCPDHQAEIDHVAQVFTRDRPGLR